MKSAPEKVAVAVDLGGTNLRAALVSEEGVILRRVEQPISPGREPEAVAKQIGGLLDDLSDGSAPVGLGIGIPGFLDPERSFLHASPNLPLWKDLDLRRVFGTVLSGSFVFENDANCAALGEAWKGAAAGYRHVVCLTLGTGVGGGVIIDGRLLHGRAGSGAELGHVVVDPDGPPCPCGGKGCLEALASGGAIRRRFGVSAEELARRAAGGDSAAAAVFADVGRYMGIALSSLGHIFSPDIFVLGGRVSRSMALFRDSMLRETELRLCNHPSRQALVVPALLGDDAGLIGAASCVFKTKPA